MFLGEFRFALDEKYRLTVPAKFRPRLSAGVILTSGADACILAYPMDEFSVVYDKITALPLTGPDAAEFRRLMFMNATDVELDKQGRVVLPESLRAYAGITANDVVVVGVGKFIEIWSPDRWQVVKAKVQDAETQRVIWAKLGI